MTRTLTTAGLLAGGALALQLASAQAAVFDRTPLAPQFPTVSSKNLPTGMADRRSPEIRVADIGSWFNQVTPNYSNNRIIQQLDQQFQKLLGDIGTLRGFPSFFSRNIYSPYSKEMEDMSLIGGYRYPNQYSESLDGTINKQVDYCTSKAMEEFYERYLNKVKEFTALLPHLKKDVPNYRAQIQGIGAALFSFKGINEQLKKDMEDNPDAYPGKKPNMCETAVASTHGPQRPDFI